MKILNAYPNLNVYWLLLDGIPDSEMYINNSGDIRNNSAGGDIIGNGAVKMISEDAGELIKSIERLTITNMEQTKQIGELIKLISNK